MIGLDLFSGIGGIAIALRGYVEPLAYCEIDPYCQSVLLSRMHEGHLPKAPIWDDVRTLSIDGLEAVEIIYGGFPCQDISIAGHGSGLDGKRSGLFFEIVRLAEEIKPKYIFLENVGAIRSRGGVRVVTEIAKLWYDCRWCCISAASIGAMHKRERWFLLAHSNSESGSGLSGGTKEEFSLTELRAKQKEWDTWPKDESPLLRVVDGISFMLDRTKALGNSVVPVQARRAFEILTGVENEMDRRD